VRVAIVHDWLTGMRGGERCLEVFCELFPEADLFTLLHNRGSVSERIESMRIHSSFVRRLPGARFFYRYYLPLFPLAVEQFDLRRYDLVLSSSHCVAKGVRTTPNQLHLCYCYTPMRYVWDMAHTYFSEAVLGFFGRKLIPPVLNYLRVWDVLSSRRVDRFIATSRHIAARIEKHYRREAEVIYPPVEVDRFYSGSSGDYYLLVSAFAPYKRIDLVLDAFRELRLPLRVVGEGQERRRLLRHAGPNVQFLGRLSDAEVAEQMANCRAFVFAAEEDFGIAPLEAQAAGKPVIAYGRGGVAETIDGLHLAGDDERDAATLREKNYRAVFFARQDRASLAHAVRFFEKHADSFDAEQIRAGVAGFNRERFKQEFARTVEREVSAFGHGERR